MRNIMLQIKLWGGSERQREGEREKKDYWQGVLNFLTESTLFLRVDFLRATGGRGKAFRLWRRGPCKTVSVLALSAYRWNAEIYNTISFSSCHTGDPVWKDLRVTSSGGKRKCMSNHWSKKSSINFRFPSLFMPIFLKKWMDGKELIPMYIILNSYSFLFCGLV